MDVHEDLTFNRKIGFILAGLVFDASLMLGVVAYAAKVAFGG